MSKLFFLCLIALTLGAFFFFDLGQWFTLSQLKSQQAALESFRAENPVLVPIIYMAIYIIVAGLSLPGAAFMTLSGGAIFGVVWGSVFANISATIGATISFLISRFIAGGWVQAKFGNRITAINKGIEQDGAFYLFSMRLVPLFPFFIINVVMGLTKLRTFTFFWVSSIGMIAGTVVYANAGTQLAKLDSLSGIASPNLLLSFALLGLFPLIARIILNALKSRRTTKS